MTDQSPPERPPGALPRLGEIGLANYAPYLMNRIMGRYNASIRLNALALRVKLADIADNTDEARLAMLDEVTAARLRQKYAKARVLLGCPGSVSGWLCRSLTRS